MQFTEKISKVDALSFIHINARSLKTNFQKIKHYILELNLQFDIIAISETWTDPDLIDDFNINSYDAYHVTRGIRRGGGVAIYTNKELCKMVETKSIAVENILECVTVKLTITKTHKCCSQLYIQNTLVYIQLYVHNTLVYIQLYVHNTKVELRYLL